MIQKKAEDLESPSLAEAHRLMELLRTLARMMELSDAALARRANVSLASLKRYFQGNAEPRLEFVLAVIPAIGLEVREFFELAYPGTKPPTAAYQKFTRLFGPIRPGKQLEDPPEPVPLRREDVETMLEDFRRDLLREIREMLGRKGR
jgi:DNA-binding phage protein